MRTIVRKVYKFEELSKEAQAVAIENRRNINVEDNDWHEASLDSLSQWLDREYGIENANISYSGFWSQGNGASFVSDKVDVVKFMKACKICNKFRAIYHKAKKNESVGMEIRRISHRYAHENTIEVTTYVEMWDQDNYTDSIWPKFDAVVSAKIKELCREIYQDLKKDYEGLTSDESVKEMIIANEYEFYKDGSSF